MENCTSCGNPLNKDARFCNYCGNPAQPAAQAAQPPVNHTIPIPQPPQPVAPAPAAYTPSTSAESTPQPAPQPHTHAAQSRLRLASTITSVIGTCTLAAIAITIFMLLHTASASFQTPMLSFIPYLLLALGTVATTRAMGADLSLGGIAAFVPIMLAGFINGGASNAITLIAATVLGLLIGCANGVLVYLLRVPAPIATLVAGLLLYNIASVCTGGTALMVESMELSALVTSPVVQLVFVAVCAIAVFLYVFFSPVGKPVLARKTTSPSYFFAYPIAGALAAMAGVFFVFRMRSIVPNMLNNTIYVDILFVWAALSCARWFDNRIAPTFVGLFAALLPVIANMALTFMDVSGSWISLFRTLLCLPLLIPAGLLLRLHKPNKEPTPG